MATNLAVAGTILIAAGDGVLADSLRFSLELEGFEARLCDEHTLLSAMRGAKAPDCLVLDQDVFTRMTSGDNRDLFAAMNVPVVLMVGCKTRGVIEQARAAGVTKVVEKPLLGGVLFDAIRTVLDGGAPETPSFRPN